MLVGTRLAGRASLPSLSSTDWQMLGEVDGGSTCRKGQGAGESLSKRDSKTEPCVLSLSSTARKEGRVRGLWLQIVCCVEAGTRSVGVQLPCAKPWLVGTKKGARDSAWRVLDVTDTWQTVTLSR